MIRFLTFSMVGVSLLGSGSSLATAPILRTPKITKSVSNQATETWFWQKTGESVLFVSDYSKNEHKRIFFYHEIDLGLDFDWQSVLSWSAWDPHGESMTRLSWGNDSFSDNPWGIFKNRSVNDFNSIDIGSIGDRATREIAIKNTAKIKLGSGEVYSGAAWIQWESWLGITRFERDASSFVAVYGHREVQTGWTFSGGRLWTNIGKGILFHLE